MVMQCAQDLGVLCDRLRLGVLLYDATPYSRSHRSKR
jgi:hypothetical protein